MNDPGELEEMARRVVGVGDEVSSCWLGSGQFCVAILVGSSLVVRFPRSGAGAVALKRERLVVDALSRYVGVSLPTPGPCDLSRDAAFQWAAHQFVEGEVLTSESVSKLSGDAFEGITGQLLGFLTGCREADRNHAFDGIKECSEPDFAKRLSNRVESILSPHMTPRQRDRAESELGELSGVESPTSTLCHTDLGGNLIWDATSCKLGVIDFGGAIISDPVFDLASLSVLSHDLVVAVASKSARLQAQLGSLTAVVNTFAIQDALNGADQGNWGHVRSVLEQY